MIDIVNKAIDRKLNAQHFTTVVSGLVESIDPLQIRINEKLTIGLGFIESKSLGLDDKSPNPALPFIVGDRINLIRYNKGQKFYVLGTAKSSGGVSDYTQLENKPKLNTNNKSSLSVNAEEEINGTINLHKISKTGSYNDLRNKPSIPVLPDNIITSPNNSLSYMESVTKEQFEQLVSTESLVPETIYNIIEDDAQITAKTDVAVGSGMIYYGPYEKIPSNYLEAVGQQLNKNDYPELFEAIGYIYSENKEGDLFNLPNMRKDGIGRVPVQVDGGTFGHIGATGGEQNVTLVEGHLASHAHYANINKATPVVYSTAPNLAAPNLANSEGITLQAFWSHAGHEIAKPTTSSGSNVAHNNLQPWMAIMYIIKVKPDAYTEDLRNLDKEMINLKNDFQNLNAYNNFSLEEQIVGKWINGKNIYRKTFLLPQNNDSATVSLETGIGNVDFLVNAYGCAHLTNSSVFIPLNFININGWNSFHLSGSRIMYEREATNYRCDVTYVTLEYTKVGA